MSEPLLDVRGLELKIATRRTSTAILHGVDLTLDTGQMHGLVGETGSGKSMTARSIIGLLPPGGRVTAGSVTFGDQDLLAKTEDEMREVRGAAIGMIFQNPRTALYPMLNIEQQMGNVIKSHLDLGKAARVARVREHLRLVGIDDIDRVAKAYPHELSGGMAQRAVIATALVCGPSLLVADEPTTGLDATIQRQILELIRSLQEQLTLSVLIITHDLGVVAQYCDTMSVMTEGRVVEDGAVRSVLLKPTEGYTKGLIAASDLGDIRTKRLAEQQ